MFDWENNKQDFVQEYLYLEDYSLFYKPSEKKREVNETPRGIIEIDLDNGKTIKF